MSAEPIVARPWVPTNDATAEPARDPWAHRSVGLRCATCMWFAPKVVGAALSSPVGKLGRCRRHAPSMTGFPAVFDGDWCGDHKLDEAKA